MAEASKDACGFIKCATYCIKTEGTKEEFAAMAEASKDACGFIKCATYCIKTEGTKEEFAALEASCKDYVAAVEAGADECPDLDCSGETQPPGKFEGGAGTTDSALSPYAAQG